MQRMQTASAAASLATTTLLETRAGISGGVLSSPSSFGDQGRQIWWCFFP
jgi:hypothetical protein